MNKQNERQLKTYKKQYWRSGGIGTGLIGFGLSALVESGFLKHNPLTEIWQWVVAGTFSLIVVMTGINLLFHSFEAKQKINNFNQRKNE